MPIKRKFKGGSVYDLDFVCMDGDAASLEIDDDSEEIRIAPFSGAMLSEVVLHPADYGVLGVTPVGDKEADALAAANAVCKYLGLKEYRWNPTDPSEAQAPE